MAFDISIRRMVEQAGMHTWYPKLEFVYNRKQIPIKDFMSLVRSDTGAVIRNYPNGTAPKRILTYSDLSSIGDMLLSSRGGECVSASVLDEGKKQYLEFAFSGTTLMQENDELCDTLVLAHDVYENTIEAHCLIRRYANECYLPFLRTVPIDLDTSYEDEIAPIFKVMHANFERLNEAMLTTISAMAFVKATLETVLYGNSFEVGKAVGICRDIIIAEIEQKETVSVLTKWNIYCMIDQFITESLPRPLMENEDADINLNAALWAPTRDLKVQVFECLSTEV